jgi:hypothetical protein
MSRALLLCLLLAACGSDDEGEHDLSASSTDLSEAADLQANADLLAPRTFRVNLIAGDAGALLQVVSYGGGCSRNFVGPCEVLICPAGTNDGWVAGEVRDHAGAISATSGTASIATAPGATGSYSGQTGGPLPLMTGDTAMVQAAGGNVPSFSASLITPASTMVTTGMPSAAMRTSDIALAFSPFTDGEFLVNFSQPDRAAICFYAAGSGTAIIPSSVLGLLAARLTTFGTYTLRRKELVAGLHGVQVRVVRTTQGTGASGSVDLQ